MINLSILEKIKNDPKKLSIAVMAVSAILIILFVYFLLLPQVTKLGTVIGRYSNARTELKVAKEEISKMGQYQADIEKFREKIDLYEKRLPAEQEMPSILENLDAMAKKSRLDILSITPVVMPFRTTGGGQRAAYQEFLIKINLRCGYHELGKLLSAMENADRFMKVVDVDIKSNEKTPTKHSVELIVATYVLVKDRDTKEAAAVKRK